MRFFLTDYEPNGTQTLFIEPVPGESMEATAIDALTFGGPNHGTHYLVNGFAVPLVETRRQDRVVLLTMVTLDDVVSALAVSPVRSLGDALELLADGVKAAENLR